uniref:Uncharacterized protein n=1 Tax=Oryza glumipatula TaxID=40148 RepID=A0A0E0B2H8_9ORYZ
MQIGIKESEGPTSLDPKLAPVLWFHNNYDQCVEESDDEDGEASGDDEEMTRRRCGCRLAGRSSGRPRRRSWSHTRDGSLVAAGQLAQPRIRRATPSLPPRDDDGDEFDLRPPPRRVHELEEVPGEFRHLMAPSFLARRHANTTNSRSSGLPRKTAAIWVPTFWSPRFLTAIVFSLVDILVSSWKLAPPL